jgi:hypothetical protein
MQSQSQAVPTLARHRVAAAPAQARPSLRRDLLAAVRDVVGVCPGMFLLGVTFGLVVVHAGLAWWWTPLFSGLIFGGSLEFLLVAMVTAAAPLAAIARPHCWSRAVTSSTPCPSPSIRSPASCAAATRCSR